MGMCVLYFADEKKKKTIGKGWNSSCTGRDQSGTAHMGRKIFTGSFLPF